MATVSQYEMHLGANSYYVATNQQVSPMYDKTKKTWSQRLKITKTDKLPLQLAPPSPSHHQLNEFASFDYSPSALSRSMKYAEPWLYSTVRGIPAARPLIHHHHNGQTSMSTAIFAPIPNEVAIVVCSCPEYLTGTKREVKKASICKKCKGSRLPLAPMGGTVRIRPTSAPIIHQQRVNSATVRLPSTRSRPSILDTQNDPYDMMRRTRLLSPEPLSNGLKIGKSQDKNTIKSQNGTINKMNTSRSRSRHRAGLPAINGNTVSSSNNIPQQVTITKTATIRSRSASRSKKQIVEQEQSQQKFEHRRDHWGDSSSSEAIDPGGRRSILECDVNPYELISYGSLNGNNEFSPPDDSDDMFETSNIRNKSNNSKAVAVAAAAAAALINEHKNSSNTNIIKKLNYSNVQAIAGQRIILGEKKTKSKLVTQNGENFLYEDIELQDGLGEKNVNVNNINNEVDGVNQPLADNQNSNKTLGNSTMENNNYPIRPPRRKHETYNSSTDDDTEVYSPSKSEVISSLNENSTKAPQRSPISLELLNNTIQKQQGIKSILKRPSSVSSSVSTTSSTSDNDAKYPTNQTSSISSTKSYNSSPTISSNLNTSTSISPSVGIAAAAKKLLTTGNGVKKSSNNHNDFIVKNNEKLLKSISNENPSGYGTNTTSEPKNNSSDGKKNSASQFYLPLPQARKKVQFMVEDKIIQDDPEDEDDDTVITTSAPKSTEKTKKVEKCDDDDDDGGNNNLNNGMNGMNNGIVVDCTDNQRFQQMQQQHKRQSEILDVLQQESRILTEKNFKNTEKINGNRKVDAKDNNELKGLLNGSPYNNVHNTNNENLKKIENDKIPTVLDKPRNNTNNNSNNTNSKNPTTKPILRRTHSDRRTNLTMETKQNVILHFNDTMALRIKHNRTATRDLFSNSNNNEEIILQQQQQSIFRPKEPPPPPPPPTPPTSQTSQSSELYPAEKSITLAAVNTNNSNNGPANININNNRNSNANNSSQVVKNAAKLFEMNLNKTKESVSQVVTPLQPKGLQEKKHQQNKIEKSALGDQKPQPSRPPRQTMKRVSWRNNNIDIKDNKKQLTKDETNNKDELNKSYENVPKSGQNVSEILNVEKCNKNSLTSNRPRPNSLPLSSCSQEKKLLQAHNEISNGARLFGNTNKFSPTSSPQKTVVRVAPFNSKSCTEIHRLKINHTDETNVSNSSVDNTGDCTSGITCNNNQKKTSILINGDDCYSTVNVSSDIPIYQSSVVVTDGTSTVAGITSINSQNKIKNLPINSSSFISTLINCDENEILKHYPSNTVTINVNSSADTKRTMEDEILYKNNKINTLLSMNASKSIIPINGSIESNKDFEGILLKNEINRAEAGHIELQQPKAITKRGRTLITLDYENETSSPKTTIENSLIEPDTDNSNSTFSHEEELVKILRNPVEAVRRNLIPHVCGKNENQKIKPDDINENTSTVPLAQSAPSNVTNNIENSTKRQNLIHFSDMTSSKSEKNSFISKLLEDPTLNQLAEGLDNEVVVKLIENSLKRLKESRNAIDTSGTKDNDDMTKLIDISLQKIREERHKLEANQHFNNPLENSSNSKSTIEEQESQSNRGSISSGNSYSSANYELFEFETNNESDCYQSCSSELTTGDDETNLTRSKFYQMLVDATLSEIEISTNVEEEHHYESIRITADPIYEEISEIPPPLPLSPPPVNDPEFEKKSSRSMFEGASKYDILSYLVDAKERGIAKEDTYDYNFGVGVSDIILEEDKVAVDGFSDIKEKHSQQISNDLSSRISHLSITSDSSEDTTSLTSSINEKISAINNTLNNTLSTNGQQRSKPSAIDIERNDSGVGSETSKSSRSKYQNPPPSCLLNKNSPIHLCEDCDGPVETQITDSGVMYAPLVCRKCGKKRAERKEIITEIVETEEKYGRDLQIILEEFCQPMFVAGLLTQEQLSAIFLNTEELLENNQALAERMRDALDIALEQGDDDLLTVNIGKIFLESAQMLHAFESYCVRQAAASLLLANLEKEKELLRIFLRVSQMENTVLRRMNLNSFLMVPVQRVTKYPLLLARLYKVTPAHLDGKELLKQAQEKIELHLNHMNQEAKDVPTKLWRRISSSSPNRRASCEIDMINIKLRKMAIDILEWNHDEVRFTMEGKLLFTQPTDSNWKKGRTIKLTPVNALLVTNGKPSTNYKADKALSDQLHFPKHTGIREASLLLVKEKCGRYTLIREPLYLDKCVICTEADWDDYFEVHEISSKDTFIFKAEDGVRTKHWYKQLQYHAQGMGAWRKRRNALANIMINGMLSRT